MSIVPGSVKVQSKFMLTETARRILAELSSASGQTMSALVEGVIIEVLQPELTQLVKEAKEST